MYDGRRNRSRADRHANWSGAIGVLITLCGLGGLVVAGGAAAGTTGGGEAPRSTTAAPAAPPLFTQCPPVGLSTGCAILIVFNADGSTTVKTDPSQAPYDGSEDTLIGVQNNSGTSKASVALTGTGFPFGLDGDGLCAGFAPEPAGCPFGPTGYEGPNTTFSNISADFNSGTVNFTGGLKSGASAYFSLEGVVTASSIHPTGKPPNIFEVDVKRCSTIHIGYNYFPVGTVIHWHVNQTGTGTIASGSTTTVAPTGKTMHFVDLTHSLTLKSGLHTHIYFNWGINGQTTRYVVTRGPSC
ncbi:MAG: hypothetical protein QOF59_1526 [Actinomycetota bacterium]|jgi:hypothetical protein|nr:hypothetical protein [Actinomycetota bacterium]MDQ1476924.1 hypothetical protein [Actinomycetota bacterium]